MITLWNTINFVCTVFLVCVCIYSILTIDKGKKALEYLKCFNSIVDKQNKYLEKLTRCQEVYIQFYESFIEAMLKDDGKAVAGLKKLASETCEKMGYKND